MTRKNHYTGLLAALGILILILDSKTALTGAQAGIDLCLKSIIPSLFPFLLVSILITTTLSGSFLRPIGKLVGIPKGSEAILITGFLGGYPTGAQTISHSYHTKQLSKQDANRMLMFCSNAGPAFLFGMVAPMFSKLSTAFILWGIHVSSALLVALLISAFNSDTVISGKKIESYTSDPMRSSILVMATICGWVIVFRIILAFLERWILWMFPEFVQVIITGILELSNGCCALTGIRDPELRFIICSGILAWGGLCVFLQTLSVTDGLSITNYLKGKLLQTLFSLLLSISVVLEVWFPVSAFMVLGAWIIHKSQNKGSNPSLIGV